MILETIVTESTKVSDYSIITEYPLNPARRVLWGMIDSAEKANRKSVEHFS